MAGKRGRKAKEPEVVEEVDSEHSVEEAPKKKRGRPNPKSDVKAEQKKSNQTKGDDEESKDSEDESKNEEGEIEETDDEPKEKAESEVMDEKENGAEDDDKEEEIEEVDEKPKRGRGRQKKEAPKEKKPAPKQAAKGKQKKTAKNAEASDSNEEDDDKVEIVEEKETAPKRKGRAAKNAHKNGDVESSPKRSSGRNANRKVTSYAEESEDEVVEVKGGKRGRGGRSKKDNSDTDSKKMDKEVRVVLEHCKSWQVYSRNAVALKEAFERVFDDIDVCINPDKPRRGSFECVLVKEDGTKMVLWSGIDKGPPRKLKFPDHQELVSRLQSELEL